MMATHKHPRLANRHRDPATMAILLLFSGVIAAVVGFAVVILLAGSIDAMVEFARTSLKLVIAGGCAFYLLLFILSMLALERAFNKLTQRR